MGDYAVRVQRIKRARFKRERDIWLSVIAYPVVCFGFRVINLIGSVAKVIVLSALTGAGFGMGLALVSAMI